MKSLFSGFEQQSYKSIILERREKRKVNHILPRGTFHTCYREVEPKQSRDLTGKKDWSSLLLQQITINSVAQNNTHLLCHSFHGSEIWEQCGSQPILRLGYHKAKIKILTRAGFFSTDTRKNDPPSSFRLLVEMSFLKLKN